jgi:hypothetical protein
VSGKDLSRFPFVDVRVDLLVDEAAQGALDLEMFLSQLHESLLTPDRRRFDRPNA